MVGLGGELGEALGLVHPNTHHSLQENESRAALIQAR